VQGLLSGIAVLGCSGRLTSKEKNKKEKGKTDLETQDLQLHHLHLQGLELGAGRESGTERGTVGVERLLVMGKGRAIDGCGEGHGREMLLVLEGLLKTRDGDGADAACAETGEERSAMSGH
jgi:hypothetical protein